MNGRAGVLAVAVAVAVAGCAVHRSRVDDAAVAVPEGYAETAEAPAAPAPADRWWTRFRDPALDGLLAEAFEGNPELERAYARLDQARAVARIAGAARLPQVDVDGQASRARQPGLVEDTVTTDYRLSVAASYEVDLWRKLDARTRAARAEVLASREAVLALYLSLSAETADLYYLLVEQRAQMALVDRTIASFEDALDRVERRYRAGLVPALDVYQARQNLAAARAVRPPLEAAEARARHALAVLLGRFPDPAVGGDRAALPAPPPVPPVGVPASLVTRRPDVRAALARLEAQDARVAAAVADRFPSLRIGGTYGTLRTAFEMGTVSGIFWNLLANLTQPVFDAGRRKAEVARSEAAFREAAAAYRKAVLVAVREVEDAIAANRATEARIDRLGRVVRATEAGLDAAAQRYQQGLSDYLPVLNAQARLFDARRQLLAARRQLLADRISLVRALGGDWMAEELDRRAEKEVARERR